MNLERLKWVDCAKGIAIILVVMGHALTFFSPNLNLGVRIIYSFHMPLFFILTGIVSAYSYEKLKFKEFTIHKVKSLMVPYLIFAIPLLIYKLFRDYFNGNLKIDETMILNTVFITRKSFISGLWFLPCLLVAQCIMHFIMRCTSKKVRLILVFIFFIGILILKEMIDLPLPLNLDNALFILPFITVGIEWKKYRDRNESLHLKWWFIVIIIFIFIGINILSIYLDHSIIYFADILFDNVLFMFLMGISGSLIVISIAENIKGSIQRIFEYCGKRSLFIYGVHYIVLGVVFQILKRLWRPINLIECSIFIIIETIIIIILILFLKEKLISDIIS